jgi:hypothetical protein
VAIPSADTVWIESGPLAGHYVILYEAHYFADGLLQAPPQTYDGLDPAAPPRLFGTKAGLSEEALACDFVSRWETGGFSVVGPITIAMVSG